MRVWIAALSFVVCACTLKVSEDNITSKNKLLTASPDMRRPLDNTSGRKFPGARWLENAEHGSTRVIQNEFKIGQRQAFDFWSRFKSRIS
jgi:hypothetical protein